MNLSTFASFSAPCSLSAITAVPQCHNSSILVMWDLMDGSERNTVYTATAEASDYTLLTCNNTGTSCSLQGAQCGLQYTISVAASSDACSSMRSPPSRVSMGTSSCLFSVKKCIKFGSSKLTDMQLTSA